MGFVPLIVGFAQKSNKKIEVKEIADSWILENNKLKNLFKELK